MPWWITSLVTSQPGQVGTLASSPAAAAASVAGRVRLSLGRGGVLARLLCPSAPALQAVAHALWGKCRERLLGLPPARLRKL